MTEDIPKRPQRIKASRQPQESEETLPTEEILAAAPKRSVVVNDDLGRVLKVKYLTTGDRMRIARVIGGDLAKNEIYLGYATLAFAVTEINGDICPPIQTAREAEYMVERLSDEGLAAVGKAYTENFSDQFRGPDFDAAKN